VKRPTVASVEYNRETNSPPEFRRLFEPSIVAMMREIFALHRTSTEEAQCLPASSQQFLEPTSSTSPKRHHLKPTLAVLTSHNAAVTPSHKTISLVTINDTGTPRTVIGNRIVCTLHAATCSQTRHETKRCRTRRYQPCQNRCAGVATALVTQ
jgi:hypothetical protein